MKKNYFKIALALLVVATGYLFFHFELGQYASLEAIKTEQANLKNYYENNQALVFALFGFAYVLVTAFSLPIAAAFTLLAGALFGFLPGLVLASFASSIGATCAFLMSRFVLGDSIQARYGQNLNKINSGFEKEGAFYLLALRMVPLFPFFLVNMLMGLVPIKTSVYYWVSQIGMLPGTAVYVYAGTQLSEISSLSDIASPQLLIAFALLGLLPVASKKILELLRRRRNKID